MNADGTNQTRLTNNTADERFPKFSPDGTKIVFTSDRDGDPEVYVMNADRTNQVQLTNDSADDGNPVVSPSSTKIIFVRLQQQQRESSR